jgi:hypothetical protein
MSYHQNSRRLRARAREATYCDQYARVREQWDILRFRHRARASEGSWGRCRVERAAGVLGLRQSVPGKFQAAARKCDPVGWPSPTRQGAGGPSLAFLTRPLSRSRGTHGCFASFLGFNSHDDGAPGPTPILASSSSSASGFAPLRPTSGPPTASPMSEPRPNYSGSG